MSRRHPSLYSARSPPSNIMSVTSSPAPRAQGSPSRQLQQPPTPVYPLRIPPQKMKKAVILYSVWCRAKEADIVSTQLDRNSSQIVGAMRPHPQHLGLSPFSPSPTSPTASSHDGASESLIDFAENESISSETGHFELTSHTGELVKPPRKRKNLNPTAKAKAALVRYLGACVVCRFRRVHVSYRPYHLEDLSNTD